MRCHAAGLASVIARADSKVLQNAHSAKSLMKYSLAGEEADAREGSAEESRNGTASGCCPPASDNMVCDISQQLLLQEFICQADGVEFLIISLTLPLLAPPTI